MGNLLRRRDVCDVLGVTPGVLRKLVEQQLLRPIAQPGRRHFYRRRDVERLAGGEL